MSNRLRLWLGVMLMVLGVACHNVVLMMGGALVTLWAIRKQNAA